jgi:hypothetical protein
VRDAAQRGEMAPIDKLAGRQGPVRFTAGCRLVSRGAAHWSRDASYAPAVAGQAKQAVRVSFFLSRRSLALRSARAEWIAILGSAAVAQSLPGAFVRY